jgi:hypothetical protein
MNPLREIISRYLCISLPLDLVSRVIQAYKYPVPPHLAGRTNHPWSLLIRVRHPSLMARPRYLHQTVFMTVSHLADVDLLCIHGRRREGPRSLVDLRLQQTSDSSPQTSTEAQGLEHHPQGMEAVRKDRFLLRRYFQIQAQALEAQRLPMMPQFPSLLIAMMFSDQKACRTMNQDTL